MTIYFAYGANLNLEDMKLRCPAAQPVQSLYLRDWQLVFNSVATIVPRSGAGVAGALWQLTQECEDSLDYFEGYPDLYTKRYLEQDGVKFMVYVMNSSGQRPPSIGYYRTIKQDYCDWRLPVELLETAALEASE